MEYLAKEHQDLAKKGLDDIRGKLHAPKQTVLDAVKSKPEEFSYDRVFRMAQKFTNRSLPTASVIWEYLLGKVVNKQQKFAVMNKLFHVQIATGPWSVAFETATNLFNETTAEFAMEFSMDTGGAGPKTTSEGSLDPSLPSQQLFDACINLGSIHRLLKELHTAEELFTKARELAVCMQDVDKEAFAKIHLAVCLLDRGELKEAMVRYFDPLMVSKSSLSNYTRALYLCYYGSTCRSAADWGRAKQYLREALELAKVSRDTGLMSSCCGELGNVFRSEGRYKDAERLHKTHYHLALSRGDIHGLAIACGNIGFLKFYNPDEFDDSLVYQFIEYSLAEQIGDFSRRGIAFNKIGKLYTTMGYYEEAVELFQIALEQARKAQNIAGEGMAWGNLGTVYRALEQFEDAIACHVKYRDNAERRLDTGGVAIMQHQLAMDYYLSGNLSEAESSVLRAFQTLEQIRAQIGEEDESKLSNFEKNQVEAYNLLQVVLVAQKKYKEAFVLADASRGRALSEIVQKRLFGSISTDTGTRHLNEEFITQSFENLLAVTRKLSTTLVLYSVVKEFDQSGAALSWVYTWVLQPKGELHFSKTRLQDNIETKVELNDDFVVSIRSSLGLRSSSDAVSEILRCEKVFGVPRERKAQLTPQNDEELESLNGIKEMFSTVWKCDNDELTVADDSLCDTQAKTKKNTIHVTPTLDSNVDLKKSSNGDPEEPSNLSATASVEHKGCHMSVSKHIAQSESGPITALESHEGTGNAISKDEPCSSIRESLPESPPKKSLQEIDSAKCESEDKITASSQGINDPTGDHQNCLFHGSLPESPSINVSGTSYPLPSSNGAPQVSYPALINAEIDPSVSENEISTNLTVNENEISTNLTQSENHADKRVDKENPLSTNDDSVGSSSSAPNTLVTNASSIDPKETERTEAFPSSVANASYTTPKEDTEDPLLSNNDVCEDTFLGPISATATGQSVSELKKGESTEVSSPVNMEQEENKLVHTAPGNDLIEGIAGVPTNDETSGSSDLHDDPKLVPWQPMLNQVHKILIEPIADFLPNKDENPRVTFIPQDFLLKVPFAALLGATGRRYVIEDFVISTSPAIHFLDLACAAREKSELNTNAEFSLLAVGNPKMPFSELPQLPSAQREVQMIREIVNSEDSEVFVGTRANKKDVVAAMPKHKILHFATHAVIDESDSHGDYSMQGLIVLAKSEDGSTCNGLLTAEEVRGMQLNAELVVLSCCDTGLGKVTGDGVLGLSRAFLAAGAACVIVTLWKIDDRSASELMTSFYREYKSSRDAAVSLQRAMKILQAKEETRSPQHWAAFSIVGSTG